VVFYRGTFAGVALLAALSPGQTTRAQVPDSPSEALAIPVGRAIVYPLYSVSVEHTDNLFMRNQAKPEEVQPAYIDDVVPGVVAMLPFSQSNVRLGYVFSHKDYNTQGIENGNTHYLVADARLAFYNGLVLNLKEDYKRGQFDNLAIDPGGNMTFVGEHYERTSTSAELALDRSPRRRLAVAAGRETNAVVGERVSALYDYMGYNAALSGEHQLGARTWATWETRGARTHFHRPVTFEKVQFEDQQDEDEFALRMGGRVRLSRDTILNVKGGFILDTFRHKSTPLSDEKTTQFHGAVGSVDVSWTRPTREWVSIGFSRDVYPTLVASGSSYYVSNQYRVQATTGSTAPLSLGVAGYYFVNEFPFVSVLEPYATRTDRITSGEIWAGYRHHGWLEWRVYFGRNARASPVPEYEYTENRIGTLLRMGS
jgi:hypothetical protein